jgi:methionine synthase II (cobalamin-independent)
MAIPTEPIGSIPRPAWLVRAGRDLAAGRITTDAYARLAEDAVRETMGQLETTGSPVITDGEQAKPSFATYPLARPGVARTGRGGDPVRRRAHAAAFPGSRRSSRGLVTQLPLA